MKLLVAIVALVAATSCSIKHRSDLFTCDTTADCEDGLVCDQGICVARGAVDAPRLDAAKPGDANNCPAQCTTCSVAQKSCVIDCQTANCTNTVTCPPGYKCDIKCNADNSCRNGINCQQAASCNIDCTGKQSCQNIQCGSGPCDVGCLGPQSCRGVSCNNSCACDVVCSGNQSCGDLILCTSLACRSGLGCTSVPNFCHSCN
jgi:hypothetical protein